MSILRDDAQKVADALAALDAHDKKVDGIMSVPGLALLENLPALTVERRRLSSVLEERAGILARLVMAATP